MIAAQPSPPRTLIEIDSGEERGGVHPDSDLLLELAARLGPCLSGVMTHAGHSYAGRSVREMARIAETERGSRDPGGGAAAGSRIHDRHRLRRQFARPPATLRTWPG